MTEIVKKLTKEQAAIIGLYTGYTCGAFADVQELADKLLGYPTFTHQFGDKQFVDMLQEKVKPMFISLCHTAD
jgi:hypothetical protein